MDKSYDEITAITSLVQSLTQLVKDSPDHINRLQTIAASMVPKETFNELCTKQVEDPSEPQVTEEYVVHLLENQRLDLVMDIQKEDFIGEKLSELIQQNEDIMGSVKEYFARKDTIRREEEDEAAQRYSKYVCDVIEPTHDHLESSLGVFNLAIVKIKQLLLEFGDETKRNDDILLSKEYQTKLNELVKILNDRIAENVFERSK